MDAANHDTEMTEEETTKIHERLAILESKVDGGPGQAAICKFHQSAVDELKTKIGNLEREMQQFIQRIERWAGGLAALYVVGGIAIPVLLHFWKGKP